MKSRNTPNKKKQAPVVKAPVAPPVDHFPRMQMVLASALLFVLATICYWQTLPYEYVLDDKIVIEENQFASKGFAGIPEIFSTESFQGYFGEQKNLLVGARYRPLSIASFAVEVGLFGKDPMIGHLGNVLFYGLSVVLLFFMFHTFGLGTGASTVFLTVPFWATVLFAMHPIHTEVVANIKGRDELFAFMFMVATMWSVLSWYDRGKMWRLALTFVLAFLGMMSKENALALVPLVPVSLYFFRKWDMGKAFRATLPVIVAAAAYLIIRRLVIGFWLDPGKEITDIMNNPFYDLSLGEHLATVMYTLLLYVKLLVFPHPLTHDYYPYQVPIMNFGKILPWAGFLLYSVMTFYALGGSRKKCPMAYGVWFYLLTLFLVSNLLFTVGTFMNERFVFIPSAGFTLILAWAAIKVLPEKWKVPSYVPVALLGLISLGYTAKSFARVPAWENTLTLNSASIKVSTNSARANLFMGTALFNEYKAATDPVEKARLLDEADRYISRAVEIHPDYGTAWNMMSGVAAEKYGMDQDLNAFFDRFYEVIRHRPALQYVVDYLEYLNKKPALKDQLVNFYIRVGYDLLAKEKRDFNPAIFYLNYAFQMAPEDPRVNEAVGNTYRLAGNETRAIEYLSKIGKQ